MGSIIKSVILTTSLISTFSVFGQTVTKLVELPESEKMIELLDQYHFCDKLSEPGKIDEACRPLFSLINGNITCNQNPLPKYSAISLFVYLGSMETLIKGEGIYLPTGVWVTTEDTLINGTYDLLIPTGLYQAFSIVAYNIAEDQLITIPVPKALKAGDILDLNIDLCRLEN